MSLRAYCCNRRLIVFEIIKIMVWLTCDTFVIALRRCLSDTELYIGCVKITLQTNISKVIVLVMTCETSPNRVSWLLLGQSRSCDFKRKDKNSRPTISTISIDSITPIILRRFETLLEGKFSCPIKPCFSLLLRRFSEDETEQLLLFSLL